MCSIFIILKGHDFLAKDGLTDKNQIIQTVSDPIAVVEVWTLQVLLVFFYDIYFTLHGEQDKAYISYSRWLILKGLKPAFIHMRVACSTTGLRMSTQFPSPFKFLTSAIFPFEVKCVN